MHTQNSLEVSSSLDDTSPVAPARSSAQSRNGLQLWWAIALAIGLTAGTYGVRKYLRQPIPYLNQAEQRSLLAETEFTGTIQPAKEFKIAAPTSAIVHQILVEQGDQVAVGQPLIILENLDLRQDFDQAEQQQDMAEQQVQQLQRQIASFRQVADLNAQMGQAEDHLSTAQLESQQVPLPQRQDSIERAQATYDLAQAQFNRMSSLYEAGALSKADLDRYGADLQVATADLKSARQAKQISQEVLDQQQNQSAVRQELAVAQQNQLLVELEGQLKAAKLQYDQWTSRLAKLEQQWGRYAGETYEAGQMIIRATETGVIINLPTTAGDQIFAGTSLVEIAQLDVLNAVVPVDARLINALRLNQKAVVDLGAGAQVHSFEAKVFSIQPIPGEDLAHQVKVQFQNPDHYLLVKQPAKVHFVTE
ncbi:hypothetical protein C7271_02110 [filamentous cyanobacterium CCP5]|nr:hypothetical protein C7271_02110 [filamentous cyanobacterium CCP5]